MKIRKRKVLADGTEEVKMGKEVKIGLSALAVLALALAVIVGLRFTRSSDPPTLASKPKDAAPPPKDKEAVKPTTTVSTKPTVVAPAPSPTGSIKPAPIDTQWATASDSSRKDSGLMPMPSNASTYTSPQSAGGRYDRYGNSGSSTLAMNPPAPPGVNNVMPQSQSGYGNTGRPTVDGVSNLRPHDPYAIPDGRNAYRGNDPRYATPNEYSTANASPGYAGSSRYGSSAADGQPLVLANSSEAPPAPRHHRHRGEGRREDGTYKVEPNDNFWTISEKLYGSSGYFKALIEANRGKITREDRLQVGMTLNAPMAEELEKKYPDLCPKAEHRKVASAAVRTTAVSTQVGRGQRVYTVAEGDTLYDIARYELGKASRWSEIYDLNREKLGEDLNYLVPGTKLVLPTGSGGGSTGTSENLTRRPGDAIRR